MRKDIAFGGVTRVPGGAVSGDGDLCAAVDVCNDGMGLEMLEKPEVLFSLRKEDDTEHGLRYTETLLCVHDPESEEHKHYITQLIVEGDSGSASAGTEGGDSGNNTPQQDVVPAIDNAIIDNDPYIIPPDHNDDTPPERATTDPYVEIVPAIENQGRTTDDIPTGDYGSVINTDIVTNNTDPGGTTVTPPSSGEYAAGIYLCYWAEENGVFSCKQMIDITPYGRVTAIQPMGNTLICNHEGGTTTVDGITVEYPAEIRYWLWKEQEAAALYIGLGSKPPMVDIAFGLISSFDYYPKVKSDVDGDDYSKYGGVSFSSYLYTDTVPVWWSWKKSLSYVPPYQIAKNETHTSSDSGERYNGSEDTVTTSTLRMEHFNTTYSIDGVVSPDGKTDVAGTKVNWTTMALGCYNKFIAEQHKDNKFVFPFYIRYAYEMYDGSLMMHSYPVLMVPNSRGPIFALDGRRGLKADLDDNTESYEKVRIEFKGRTYGYTSTLMHEIFKLSDADQARLENWKDLIRGISIYITPPIYNYKQGGQVLGWHCMDVGDPANMGKDPWEGHYTIGKVHKKGNIGWYVGSLSLKTGFTEILDNNNAQNADRYKIFMPWNSTYLAPDYCLTIPQKEDEEIMELHEHAGQFYKLTTIEYEKLVSLTRTGQSDTAVEIKGRKLNTIANQEVMQDDNGSHDTLSADVLYGYNRRLNMANVRKVLHSPLSPKILWTKDYSGAGVTTYPGMSDESYSGDYYQVVVYARNGAQIARLRRTSLAASCYYPLHFFYPNTDAFEAVIYRNTFKFKIKLKEHKALNGVFWLGDFLRRPDVIKAEELVPANANSSEITLVTDEANKIVDESNKIYTTETDNPFYVPFGNINIAGGGDVRALCSATQALSQGQFGQHPMYCFTSEGVWAMSVNQTGGWGTIQPVTRDVISEGTMPLSLDSTVVFLTERGLLQLAGSQVKVLSDVLQGADPLLLATPNFGLHRLDELCGTNGTNTSQLLGVATALANGKFPEKAWLAYDYDNARIYVTEQDGTGSWVYNIKSGLWTQASVTIDRQTPTYPELETQSGNNVIHISVDRAILGNLCDKGLVITRPVKFADMGALKRWRELVVRGRFVPYGNAVQCALWGTRNWVDHALVASSQSNRLTRWGGSPYFGHSVGLFLTKPTGYALQVSGMDAEIEAERMNKLR